jgi:hypothetical protein
MKSAFTRNGRTVIAFETANKEKTLSCGLVGFRVFRIKLAKQIDPALGDLYRDTSFMKFMPDVFNRQFDNMVSDARFSGKEELIQFLRMSHECGEIPARLCKKIAEIMESNHDDDTCGYDDNPDKVEDLTEMMKWCAEHRRKLIWYRQI